MALNTSRVQANYALTILRIARDSELDVAVRLLAGLMIDLPTSDVTAEQAMLHQEAIDVYGSLIAVLRSDGGNKSTVAKTWLAAQAATERWLSVT